MAGRRAEEVWGGGLGDRAWRHGNIPSRPERIGPPLPGSINRVCQGRAAGSFRLKVLITGEERLFGADAALCYVRVLPDLDGKGTTEFFFGWWFNYCSGWQLDD